MYSVATSQPSLLELRKTDASCLGATASDSHHLPHSQHVEEELEVRRCHLHMFLTSKQPDGSESAPPKLSQKALPSLDTKERDWKNSS